MNRRPSIRRPAMTTDTMLKDLGESYITEELSRLPNALFIGKFDHVSLVFPVDAFTLHDHPT